MKKEELLEKLIYIGKTLHGDPEVAHGEADDALIAYIDDQEIKSAYDSIHKWYA